MLFQMCSAVVLEAVRQEKKLTLPRHLPTG